MPLIIKLQQEELRFYDICVSWACEKLTWGRMLLGLES